MLSICMNYRGEQSAEFNENILDTHNRFVIVQFRIVASYNILLLWKKNTMLLKPELRMC
jgi:hypothetical protein